MGEGYSKSHWVKDETAKSCKACRSEFALTKRRHHCRNCGYIFCGQCSFRTQPVPQRGIDAAVRVCDECYYSLLATDNAPPLAATQSRYGGSGSRENSFNSKAAANAQTGPTMHEMAHDSPSGGGGQAPAAQAESGSDPISPMESTAPPAKSLEQIKAERMSQTMEKIRRDLLYVDASMVAVEPIMADEMPMWAPDLVYNIEVLTTECHLIPFPQPAGNTVGLLFGAPAKEPTLGDSHDVDHLAEGIAALMSVDG